MTLFAIDFDFTIAGGHTHNKIMSEAYYKDLETQWKVIKDVKPIVSTTGKTWKDAIENLITDGHHICIVSFNAFPHIIPRYLKEVIKLNETVMSKIKVESFIPENPNAANKNQHILRAIKQTGCEENSKDIALVDDSSGNIYAAKSLGYLTITANPKSGHHIDQVIKLSNTLKKKSALMESKPDKEIDFTVPQIEEIRSIQSSAPVSITRQGLHKVKNSLPQTIAQEISNTSKTSLK